MNVIDIFESGLFVGAFICTLESVFEHVELLTYVPRADGARETFVIAASDRALEVDDLVDDEGRLVPVILYDRIDMDKLRERAGHRVLVDDHAPVETLLAPVVRNRGG